MLYFIDLFSLPVLSFATSFLVFFILIIISIYSVGNHCITANAKKGVLVIHLCAMKHDNIPNVAPYTQTSSKTPATDPPL
ncbi:hypothetical protein XELAEV_18035745mg [Xenopus laevis]|uniref:Uncharacterized protein n=1 Tax=Xenopus laevis TaxID=8355 RepID=A0A974CGK7_XENLA|nr:hypothetical protein XELAEV_18035745mg [Xenopus laevis]